MLAQWCCDVLATVVARVRGVVRVKVLVEVLSHKGISSEVGNVVMKVLVGQVKDVFCSFEIGSAAQQ